MEPASKKGQCFGDPAILLPAMATQNNEAITDEEFVDSLKNEFTTRRFEDIKDMIERNRIKLSTMTHHIRDLSTIRQTSASVGTDLAVNLLTSRQDDALHTMHGLELSLVEKDDGIFQEESWYGTSTVTLGGNLAEKNANKPIELPKVSKRPPYVTWMLLDRNQRMTEDQSVLGYYDTDCGGVITLSDTEDEVVDGEEEKREFSISEDCFIQLAIEDCQKFDVMLEILAQYFDTTAGDIKARYEILQGKKIEDSSKEVSKLNVKLEDIYRDKDLDAALDSFNNLFCRRCLIFDCKLHGCSQNLVFPAETQSPWNSMDDGPCGIHCYKLATKHKDSIASSQHNCPSIRSSRKKDAPQMENNSALVEDRNSGRDSSRKEDLVDENIRRQEDNDASWKVIEQGLLVKGLEIFGRNSCLIAQNLLGGEKTCSDVFQYMSYIENNSTSGVFSGFDSVVKGYIKGHESGVRSRFCRRRGRVRYLRHTSKSAGCHFIRKRIAEKKGDLRQHYNPCGCQSACGKQCPCLTNDTCCEKFCGCPKMCKNRFRGCHCAKSRCRSRQCPCFAADRECDPDVCRNCWVGCGDGSLGVPSQRGENYECQNMKLLLGQRQKVIVGRSNVSGWGAFVKNAVGKDECLGEYTGELISHVEADKRGKKYDHENISFLFNLNNEFVLDAFRMGNKLKFANHSPDPNCYAKVMLVAGDHRVGIFTKERISAGEEIFYDYHHAPDETPAWALKLDGAPGAKDPGQYSSGRAKRPDAPGAEDPGQSSSGRGKRPDAPGAEARAIFQRASEEA